MEPRITFLVPAYNAMPTLRETVASIKAQTLKDFEAVIVNDGSSDGTGAYLDSLDDSRFRIIHQENRGIVEALRVGQEQVRTPYFARLDADDISLPTRLEKQVALLDAHPEVAIVGTRIAYVFGARREFRISLGPVRVHPTFAPPMANPPFWSPKTDGQSIAHPSAAIRTAAFRQIGGYRDLAPTEDLDLWLRMEDAGFKLACLDEVLVLYRVCSTSVSSRNFSRQVLTGWYARYCHRCRMSGEEEMSYEEFAAENPLTEEQLETVQARAGLRNAMADLLAGRFLRGAWKFSASAARHPDVVMDKVRARLR